MSSPARSAVTQPAAADVDEEFPAHPPPHSSRIAAIMIPDVFTTGPPIRDVLETDTSKVQDETVEACLSFLTDGGDAHAPANAHGVPRLRHAEHVRFLRGSLGRLPPPFVAADASRPWFFYWSLNALALLGEDVSSYRPALVETARSIQNETGGFGGGFGQTSHLATTYAVVLSLAIVGGEDCFEVVDRRSLWKWLCILKQPDGGFRMGVNGEEDIRGAYCAAVIISLLQLPLYLTRDSPAWTADESATLLTGLGEYARRCQTFEGGISGEPDAEAHGAYAFCALGCLSILGPPDQTIPRYLDVPRLVSWLSSRQHAPEGGFSGRTNKLVDGCYSHWVGGCWPLIEACLDGPPRPDRVGTASALRQRSLFSREGLLRYILCCCQDQSKRGGLRDKPGRPSDAYHSCYVLSGLSSVQNKWQLASPREGPLEQGLQDGHPGWVVSPYFEEVQIFDDEDRVGTIHPVYTIPERRVDEIKAYFAAKMGF